MSATSAPSDSLALRGYAALVEHAELELELAGRGQVEDLAELGTRWDELVASLPSRPPAQAAQMLERAQLIHERTRVELMRLRDALLADLSTARRARRTAEGYAGGVPARSQLDRSA